jgi:hypothetical protein
MTRGKEKIIYLVTTGFIAIISILGAWGLLAMPFFINTVTAMGYPDYFRITLAVFKIIGGLLLLTPVPARLKEWAYAGISINVISAIISFCAIQAPAVSFISPVIALLVLIVSYIYFYRTANLSPLGTFNRYESVQ